VASDVEIVNAALAKLGEQAILAFSDPSEPGRLATRTFADLRDAMLRENPWNFASKRAELAAEPTAPLWGFQSSYPVPSDYLRLIELEWGQADYRIEQGKILCDLASPLRIRYVYRVTDADAMDPAFREALASRLAMEWAEPLTGTTSLTEQMAVLYRRKLSVALAIDGQEDGQRTLDPMPSFIRSRW
jgi:hypothetical protein